MPSVSESLELAWPVVSERTSVGGVAALSWRCRRKADGYRGLEVSPGMLTSSTSNSRTALGGIFEPGGGRSP